MRVLVLPDRARLANIDVSVVRDPERPRLTELRRRESQLRLFRERLARAFPGHVSEAAREDDKGRVLPCLEAFFADDAEVDVHRAVESREISILYNSRSIRRGASVAGKLVEVDGSHLKHINLSWPQPPGDGAGTLVGTADAGLIAHADFGPKIVSAAYLDNNGDLHEDLLLPDPDGHGTRVAGLLAGDKTGVVPGAKLAFFGLPSRALGEAYDFSIFALTEALDWLGKTDHGSMGNDVGCDVINLSLEWVSHSEKWFELIVSLFKAGTLVVAGAGNRGPEGIASPANYDNVLSVGSTDLHDTPAANSATGQAFPNSTLQKPELHSVGEFVCSTAPDGGYSIDSGTSFAAPLVAGSAALLISRDPAKLRMRPDLVIRTLLSSDNTEVATKANIRVLHIG